MTLEQIIQSGNRSFNIDRLRYGNEPSNKIRCADGFTLSVIAGDGTYCAPRLDGHPGPFAAVEVGYPSERPEPWHCAAWNDGYDRHEDHPVCDGWGRYAEGDTYEDTSVYGYVPVEMVRALVASHGGEV